MYTISRFSERRVMIVDGAKWVWRASGKLMVFDRSLRWLDFQLPPFARRRLAGWLVTIMLVVVAWGVGGIFMLPVPAHAQADATPAGASSGTPAPNYILNLIYGRVSEDRRLIEVQFGIINVGGTSTLETQAELIAIDASGESRVVASAEVRPLAGNNDTQSISLNTDAAQFVPGVRQQFRIQIASQPGQPTITSDIENFTIEIPLDVPAARGTGSALVIPGLNLTITIDLSSTQQRLIVIGIAATALLLLVLFITLIRLFQRQPDFRTPWQPPYATTPPLDPYSAAGIRQSWQTLAQNNLIVSLPTPGTYHIIKLLIGTDGRYLSGWQLVAMRLIQYDPYGRVSRTETIANTRTVRALARLMNQSGRLPREKLLRRVTPIAKRLAKQFRRKITARSAMLPIALDLRFRGTHGEVNILFELYRWENSGTWQVVDRWQPEMMIVGRSMLESYTYSIYGQAGGETSREFRKRMVTDLARLLVELIGVKPVPMPTTVTAPLPAPTLNATGTTSGRDGSAPPPGEWVATPTPGTVISPPTTGINPAVQQPPTS
jgi:hypothetical protein